MNRIEKRKLGEETTYYLITEDNKEQKCELWFEKKTNQYHIKLPKDNSSGRTYIRLSKLDNCDTYEFETKTEFRTLGSTNWETLLTDDEKQELQKCRDRIEELKQIGKSRTPEKPEKNSAEYIELQIKKLREKLMKMGR